MKISKLLLTLLAILPLAITAAWANAQPPGHGSGNHLHGDRHMGLDQLGLSEDQIRAFHQTMKVRHESQRAMQELQQQLTELAYSDNYTAADAENIIRDFNEKLLTSLSMATQDENNLYALLNEDQKKALREFVARHKRL